MTIAVDKNSVGLVKDNNEYIYLFDDESLDYLLSLNIKCIRYDRCEFVDINVTDYDVDSYKKAKPTDKDYDVMPKATNYKIGIIIPNYNYEHTIEKCLESILNQKYTNYQIVLIDDMSTDKSVEIARKMLKPPHKIVELKQKRLNGGARNEGYLYLDKDVDYVWYVDSDDWLYNDRVLERINMKLQGYPDVLFVGMASFKKTLETCFIPEYKDKYDAIQGWSGSCGKVIKKGLATRQECLYKEGTLKEDRNQHCKICIYMKDFKLLKEPVYVWNQQNYKSVTTIRRKNILWETSTIRHYADTLELYLSEKGKDKKIDEYLKERVKMSKDEMLNGGDRQW